MNYDLEERTSSFGKKVIALCKKVRQDPISRPLISQLIRSATSVGANYMEANGASSKRDFVNKVFICKKESQETKHWLRMISEASPEIEQDANKLIQESKELALIFQKIAVSTRKNIDH